MRSKRIGRSLMIVAGVVAALIILFSPAFQRETSQFLTNTKSEKPVEHEKQFVAVPSDAVTSGQAGEVETANPFVIQEIIAEPERKTILLSLALSIPATFFRTLLSTVISPQAP